MLADLKQWKTTDGNVHVFGMYRLMVKMYLDLPGMLTLTVKQGRQSGSANAHIIIYRRITW